MYTCGECGWTGDNPDEWTHDLWEYVNGSESNLMCIPIGTCPAVSGDENEWTCGASIFEPTALAELELLGEMVILLESIHFQHRSIDPTIARVIGKARRLGLSAIRSRKAITLDLKG